MGALTIADLVPGDAEPRIKDLVLAERLGFEDRHKIRDLITRNWAELLEHGPISAVVAENRGRGRPGKSYLLNEGQALTICALARTPAASKIRVRLINVFMAYRRGELVPADRVVHQAGAKTLPAGLSENQAAEARARLAILNRVAKLEDGGMVRTHAIAKVAGEAGVSRATIYNWFQRFNGAGARDALVAIAPQWNAGGQQADIPESIWLIFMGAQLEMQNAAQSYRLARATADANGVDIPHCKTFHRRFQRAAISALRNSLTIEGTVQA